MDCNICPKRRQCSGADCYYDYYPEAEPERELAEDMAVLDSLEGR